MLPKRSENILQDTKNVPGTLVKSKKHTLLLVFILFGITFIGLIGLRLRRSSQPAVVSQRSAEASEPTPAALTHTFVDTLSGEFVYFEDGMLQSMHLPDRTTRTIVGVGDKQEIELDASITPAWSPDGRYLAVATKESNIVVSEFDTGRFVGSYPLPKADRRGKITIAIDPASEVLVISTLPSEQVRDHVITFYSLLNQQKLGVYPSCSGAGVFVTGVGYATRCAVGESMTISIIRFEPSSSLMTTIAKESHGVSYQLVDEYQPGSLLVQRTRGSTKDLIAMNMTGTLRVIAPKEYAPVTDIAQIVDAIGALSRRIESAAKITAIRSVSVASDSSFVVFESDSGIALAPLSLKESPYFIGLGHAPLVRPD